MSEIFHKSCYTVRSTGYKYRTLSTNTGDKKRRDSVEDCTFDTKLKELKWAMNTKIQNEVDKMADARDSIRDKFLKIDTKIDSLINLQKTVLGLRDDLNQAESTLVEMLEKINKLEVSVDRSEPCSLRSRKSSYRSQQPTIFEEKELCHTNITHILV